MTESLTSNLKKPEVNFRSTCDSSGSLDLSPFNNKTDAEKPEFLALGNQLATPEKIAAYWQKNGLWRDKRPTLKRSPVGRVSDIVTCPITRESTLPHPFDRSSPPLVQDGSPRSPRLQAKTRHDSIQYCQQALSDLHYRSSERPEVSEHSRRTKQAWVE